MGITIEDGVGTGRSAAVDINNRVMVNSISSTIQHFVNHRLGKAFSVGFSVTPTGPLDCFGYITNLDEDDMVLGSIMFRSASDETVIIKLGDTGTAVGGATVTPVNRNAGSGNIADVTAEYGVNITGFAGGSNVASVFVKGGESSKQVEINSSLIIPKNKTISFYVQTGTSAIVLGTSIYFRSE